MNPPRQTNERSDIRMNLAREFRIGAWATFLYDRPFVADERQTQLHVRSRPTTDLTDTLQETYTRRHHQTPLPCKKTTSSRAPGSKYLLPENAL